MKTLLGKVQNHLLSFPRRLLAALAGNSLFWTYIYEFVDIAATTPQEFV